MQNQIKTLWEQTTHTCVPREGDYVSVSSKNIQEFAELLIKECITKCRTDWYGDSLDDICAQMLKHFGIKE